MFTRVCRELEFARCSAIITPNQSWIQKLRKTILEGAMWWNLARTTKFDKFCTTIELKCTPRRKFCKAMNILLISVHFSNNLAMVHVAMLHPLHWHLPKYFWSGVHTVQIRCDTYACSESLNIFLFAICKNFGLFLDFQISPNI